MRRNKYYIPESVWPEKYYPYFCGGNHVFYSSDAPTLLLEAQQRLTNDSYLQQMFLDDVLFNGVFAHAVGYS